VFSAVRQLLIGYATAAIIYAIGMLASPSRVDKRAVLALLRYR
jgi:hypothetical protein